MLFLCVIRRATATKTEKILNRSDGESNRVKSKTGKATPALIDPSDI
jgi:hypothetical protein